MKTVYIIAGLLIALNAARVETSTPAATALKVFLIALGVLIAIKEEPKHEKSSSPRRDSSRLYFLH